MLEREIARNLPNLSWTDRLAVLFFVVHRHLMYIFPDTPLPIRFGMRALVTMFILMGIVSPATPLSIPVIIGGGLSLALLME